MFFFQYSTILLGIKLMGFKYFFNKIRHFKLLMHISEGTYTTFNWIQQKVNKIRNIKKYFKKSITFFLGRIKKRTENYQIVLWKDMVKNHKIEPSCDSCRHIVCHELYSMHQIWCFSFYAYCSLLLILYILFYSNCSVHVNLSIWQGRGLDLLEPLDGEFIMEFSSSCYTSFVHP